MLIIDRLELEFQAGLNVLTGETGAGKSILLDSLGFVLGWRGRAELVRSGAEQGEVTAWFDLGPDHPAHKVLEDAGLPGGAELILRRINGRDGRKTAWINDRRASGEVLRALSETLVELHGQHDDRGLLNPRGHMALLDAFAGHGVKQAAVRKAWQVLRGAKAAHDQALAAKAALAEEEDFLRHAAAELASLAPEPGEEARLDTKRRMMQAADRVREDITSAQTALGPSGAEGPMQDAVRWLDGAAEAMEGAVDGPLEALGRAMDALAEAEAGVVRILDALSFDANDLELTEERLFALRALARKHEVQPDDLAELAMQLEAKLAALDGGAGLAELEAALAQAQAAYDKSASNLSASRSAAAGRLDKAMGRELAPLKMERAVFVTEVEAAAPGPEGTDAVSFTVATNPGAPSGPLAKIASGGELSRFLLALKVCLSGAEGECCMIFDEIDRGVGGATADAVGRRLADLAEGGQVLVVTHSPQVAALGAHHWRVEKQVSKGMTLSTVKPLSAEERIGEVARMLSGDTVTEEARAAARALLG